MSVFQVVLIYSLIIATYGSNNRRNLYSSPDILSLEDKQAILDLHNSYRSLIAGGHVSNQPEASNMHHLFWDEGLANLAKEHSSKCKWAFNTNRTVNQNNTSFKLPNSYSIGENLYITSRNHLSSMDDLTYGIDSWHSEHLNYNYNANECANGFMCSHYKQVCCLIFYIYI